MYLKIYCDYCGQSWEVYPRGECESRLINSKQNHCPHCGAAKIDRDTWEELIYVLMKTKRINEKLAADHVNKHNALFAVSFIADHLFTCPVSDLEIPDRCPNID